MGRSISDNFKKRFGDPARIKIKFAKGKLLPLEEAYRNEKTATAYENFSTRILGPGPYNPL